MSNFPYSSLFLGKSQTVLISGPHIQVLETKTGNVLYSSAIFDGAAKDELLKSGHVRCAAVDTSHLHLATSGDDKVLKVWRIDGLQLLSARELPKKPTSVQFLRDGQTILVSDKFGDIFSYPLHPIPGSSESSEPGTSKRDSLTSHENPSGGTLILGHVSVLTSFVLSADERYVITADRDEHVRVSWYPQGWNVEMFCLGHKKYVSAVHVPSFSPETLISGGGDPELKIWDWMAGRVRIEVEVWSRVQRFVKIESGRKGRGWGEEAGAGRRRKRRNKAKGNQSNEGEDEGEDIEELSGEASPSTANITLEGPSVTSADPEKKIQVVHKIDSFDSGTGRYILFNAVGATAIFIFPFPPLNTLSSPPPTADIYHFDFGRPVLDFVIGNEGIIWVLLDGTEKMVRLVKWDSVAEELKETHEVPEIALLTSLNSSCLLPATQADLKSLDLYAQLSSMPKNSSDHIEGVGDESPRRGKRKNKDKVQPAATKRELGRLKNKRALARAVEGSMGREECGDEDGEACKDTEVGRGNKRPKSGGGTAEGQDMVMDEL